MASRGVTGMRPVALGLLSLSLSRSLSLSLALARPVLAQEVVGTLATGTIALRTPRGSESGTIRVEAAAGECKVEITLDAPGRRRTYTALLAGKKVAMSAPAGVAELAPLPVDPQVGCALLPRAAGQTANWSSAGGTAASLAWGADSDGTATFTESVSGSERLRIRFTSVSSQSFPASEFALPGGGK